MSEINDNRQYCNSYFWRTNRQQEIDFLEESDGKLHAYEFKWKPSKNPRAVSTFMQAYPDADYQEIHKENFFDFLKA